MTPTKMTTVILNSLGHQSDNNLRHIIEAVIEKEFMRYEEALTDIDNLIREIDDENMSTIEGLIRDKINNTKQYVEK